MKVSLRTLVAVGSVVAVSGLASGGSSDGELLYDIDFSEPFHTFGDFVSLDTGPAVRQGFSGYFLTDPADEAQVDGVFDLRSMTDGVGIFPNNAQALMELENSNGVSAADYDIYTLEFDASFIGESGLTVFFDAPAINRFYMGSGFPDASVGVITYGSGPTALPELAPFTLGELLKVRVDYNTVAQRWRIEIDGEVLYQGPVQNEIVSPEWIRFSASAGAVVDNVKISGSFIDCGDADLNDDGILDLQDISAFVTAFTSGCMN